MGSSPLARGLLRILRAFGPRWRIIPARAGFTNLAFDGSFILEDHPRSRGVYAAAAWEQTKAAGSSPLARGLPRDRQPRGGPRRIIPARAGFTSSSTSSSTSSRDHPRSRGVYASSSSTSEGEEGSSPLARGLRSNDDSAGGEGGIIPARAGFTPPWNRPQCSSAGSSPLARGLLRALRNPRVKGGIIPARAGFTVFDVGAGCDRGDHPRSRGVYSSPVRASPRRFGSSPLARGLRAGPPIPGAEAGIIPARAGFTGPPGTRPPPWPDHPRSRGVYQVPDPLNICLTGSSPLARGLPTRFTDIIFRPRIIPARAGFTTGTVVAEGDGRDHPRSRGVYPSAGGHPRQGRGSSPLARGLRDLNNCMNTVDRIIPARAGFTAARWLRAQGDEDHPRSRGVYRRGRSTPRMT